jgi:hypothetical protein
MVLMMARWETGPCERWPKMLKGELENNFRKPGTMLENWHSDKLTKVQLTLSQGKKKKGDKVADDEDVW